MAPSCCRLARQEEIAVPSQRTFLARWPDEIKVTQAFKAHIPGTMTMILNRSFTWAGLGNKADSNPNPAKSEEVMRTDGLGMHWITLLFPLTDRHAIVFEPRKGTGVGSPPADVVKLALPGRPVYRLHFSPRTSYLIQTDYVHEDAGGVSFKEWLMDDYKLFSGVMLPTKLTMNRTPGAPRRTAPWRSGRSINGSSPRGSKKGRSTRRSNCPRPRVPSYAINPIPV